MMNRRGAVMPLVCVLLTVLLGCAALAVDLGRLHYTATEAQGAADAAALAAAAATQIDPANAASNAPAFAQSVAARNRAADTPGRVADADVVGVAYDPVTRTATNGTWARANGVQVTARAQPAYAFAGIFDLAPPIVSRAAPAWVANVDGAACMRPFALPYTRIYEDGYLGGRREYSSKSSYAPDLTQANVTAFAPTEGVPASQRTFVLIPPSEDEADWDTKGKPNSGSWHTVDFRGHGYSGFTTYISAPTGSAECRAAFTQVGEYLRPFSWRREDFKAKVLHAAKPGIVELCNRVGNLLDARCRDADGNVGVKARMPFADSIPNKTGPFSQKVRMVSQVRIMCYFMDADDVCAATPIRAAGGGTTAWQMPSDPSGGPPVDKGYPEGTIVVLLDGPVSIDITPDVVFGNTIGFTQRLLLVR